MSSSGTFLYGVVHFTYIYWTMSIKIRESYKNTLCQNLYQFHLLDLPWWAHISWTNIVKRKNGIIHILFVHVNETLAFFNFNHLYHSIVIILKKGPHFTVNLNMEFYKTAARQKFGSLLHIHLSHRRWYYAILLDCNNPNSLASFLRLSNSDLQSFLIMCGLGALSQNKSFSILVKE